MAPTASVTSAEMWIRAVLSLGDCNNTDPSSWAIARISPVGEKAREVISWQVVRGSWFTPMTGSQRNTSIPRATAIVPVMDQLSG